MAKKTSDFSGRYNEIDALIIKIKKNWQKEDIDRLIELHTPLLKRAIKRHRNLNPTEVFNMAKEVFIDLVHFFDPAKGVYFNKFTSRAFWWRLLARLKKCQPIVLVQEAPISCEHNIDLKEYYELVRLKCGEIAGDIFLLKIIFGLTRREVASIMDMSQKTVALHWQQVVDFLQENENI